MAIPPLQPAATFEATFDQLETGLVGVAGWRINDGQGATVTTRSTTGVIEDPAGSGSYNITGVAPSVAGSYNVVFDTGGDDPLYLNELLTVAVTDPGTTFPDGTTPTVAEVSALLRARTYVNGQYHGVFDDETRPTGDEVQDLILMAASYVLGRTGTTSIPTALAASVRYGVALRAAALIEMSYWPEQAQENGSMFDMLTQTFDTHLAGLIDNLADINLGADHRIGTIAVTSPTLAAYEDVYGIDLNDDLPL